MKKKFIAACIAAFFLGFAPTLSFAGANLIANGKFERTATGSPGSPDEWRAIHFGKIDGALTYPHPGRSGNGVKIDVRSAWIGSRGFLLQSMFPLAVTGGEKYVYADFVTGDGVKAYLDVRFTMKSGRTVYNGLAATRTFPWWTKTVRTITVPANAVAMSVYRVAADPGSFVLDDVSLTAPALSTARGYVSLSFDDGRNEKTVGAILKKHGVKATFFLDPKPLIEQWEAFNFTPAEIVSLMKDGNEIANHTMTHRSLIGLSPSELRHEIADSKRALEDLINRSVLTFAYPYGDFDQVSYDVVKQYHIGARGVVSSRTNARTDDRNNIYADCVESTETVPQLMAKVDAAASGKTWLVLCFHQISGNGEQYSYHPADLEAVIQYAKQRVRVITVREGLSRYMK